MAYQIGETVVITKDGLGTLTFCGGSEHLLERNGIVPLVIRAERDNRGRREIAFNWIRDFHPDFCFVGEGCESETVDIAVIDGETIARVRGLDEWGRTMRIVGTTPRGSSIGLDVADLDGRTGTLVFRKTEDGVLVDDFSSDDRNHVSKEAIAASIRRSLAYAQGRTAPDTVLLAIIDEHVDLTEIARTNGAMLRWQHPGIVVRMWDKFGIPEGAIIARTTYGNIADPVAMAANDDTGCVSDLAKVILPSLDSIGYDDTSGDDERTLAEACASKQRYAA